MIERLAPAIGLAIGATAAGLIYALAELIAHSGELIGHIGKACL